MGKSRASFGFGSSMLCLMLWTFLDTTLAIKLEDDFDLNSDMISLVYAAQMVGFLPTSLLVHNLFDRLSSSPNATLLIVMGFVC